MIDVKSPSRKLALFVRQWSNFSAAVGASRQVGSRDARVSDGGDLIRQLGVEGSVSTITN
jgi:hypothetical protein